jgi:hypothetical protein
MTDDLSIIGAITVYRRVQPGYVSFDSYGDPVMSDGVFEPSNFRFFVAIECRSQRYWTAIHQTAWLKSPSKPFATQVVWSFLTNLRSVISVLTDKDVPRSRIGSGSAAKMTRAARWIKLPASP